MRKSHRYRYVAVGKKMVGGGHGKDVPTLLFECPRLKIIRNGRNLFFCDIKEGVCRQFISGVGSGKIFMTKNDAIARIFDRLDHNICRTCTKRILTECHTIDP